MTHYPPFTLSIGVPKNSPSQFPPFIWEYDSPSKVLSSRDYDHPEREGEIEVEIFEI